MSFMRAFRPTNSRVRLGVGLILAALFCIQCTRSEAVRDDNVVTVVDGKTIGHVSPARLAELEKLAKTNQIELLKQSIEHYRVSYQDYTCTFSKTERIDGQLRATQKVDVKFRQAPFSVAMHWLVNAPTADRMLFVQGKYDGQMLVMPKGMLSLVTGGAVLRDPAGKDAMANTLRPVSMFGFENAMTNLLDVYQIAAKRNELQTSFLGYGEICGRKVFILQRVLPYTKEYAARAAKTTVVYLDVEYLVPLALENHDWTDQLVSKYTYSDIKFNLGLGDKDFTPEANDIQYNPAQK